MRLTSINSAASRLADLADVNSHDSSAMQVREARFIDALAEASDGAGAQTLTLEPAALNAADEAWVNFVALSEQLQNPRLSQDRQNAIIAGLAENLKAFREQSGPLMMQVDQYLASREATALAEKR